MQNDERDPIVSLCCLQLGRRWWGETMSGAFVIMSLQNSRWETELHYAQWSHIADKTQNVWGFILGRFYGITRIYSLRFWDWRLHCWRWIFQFQSAEAASFKSRNDSHFSYEASHALEHSSSQSLKVNITVLKWHLFQEETQLLILFEEFLFLFRLTLQSASMISFYPCHVNVCRLSSTLTAAMTAQCHL